MITQPSNGTNFDYIPSQKASADLTERDGCSLAPPFLKGLVSFFCMLIPTLSFASLAYWLQQGKSDLARKWYSRKCLNAARQLCNVGFKLILPPCEISLGDNCGILCVSIKNDLTTHSTFSRSMKAFGFMLEERFSYVSMETITVI